MRRPAPIAAAGLRMLLQLALLLGLVVPTASAVEIVFDYSFDTNNFFADPQRRQALEAAARIADRLGDRLLPIEPEADGPQDRFTAVFSDPATGNSAKVENLDVAQDTLVVFVGGRPLPGLTLAVGGPGGFEAAGSAGFLNQVSRRGQGVVEGDAAVDIAPWGGHIAFDTEASWSTSLTGPEPGRNDLFSTALHELGHLLGIGTSDAWNAQIDTLDVAFNGTQSVEVFGQPVPLEPDRAHWRNGTLSQANGQTQEAALDPSLSSGTRKYFTDLDLAALSDIGWQVAPLGDADRDNDVDTSDFNVLILSWTGAGEPFSLGRHFYEGDFDDDWDVDAADLAALITGWTGAAPAEAAPLRTVPEPSPLAPALLGLAVVIRGARRPARDRRKAMRPGSDEAGGPRHLAG